jgi:hypothetical protein
MSKDLKTKIVLDKIKCIRSGEMNGGEPYMWATFFTISGTSIRQSADKSRLEGEATFKFGAGSERNLGVNKMHDGQVINIPATIGSWSTSLRPIDIEVAIPNQPKLNLSVPAITGTIVLLLEENAIPSGAREAGHNEYNRLIKAKMGETLNSINALTVFAKYTSIKKANPNISNEDALKKVLIEIFQEKLNNNDTINEIKSAVTNTIKSKLGPFEILGAGIDRDKFIGYGIAFYDQKDIEASNYFKEFKMSLNGPETSASYELSGFLQAELPDIGIPTSRTNLITVYRQGTDAHALWVNDNWAGFSAKWGELSNQNLRLTDIDTYMLDGERRFTGVFRAGTDGHFLWVGVSWNDLVKKWEELAKSNLRLIKVKTYEEGRQRKYIGIWRQGNDSYFLFNTDVDSFLKKWGELNNQHLRLVDIESYVHNGKLFYIGVWRQGNDGHVLWIGLDWNTFVKKWEEAAKQNLRLMDVDTYVINGKRVYSGVWRQGTDGYILYNSTEKDSVEKWREWSKQNLRLVSIKYYTP